MGPRFKFRLLGKWGMFIAENGHSIISKYLFTNSLVGDRFFYHAREAETATGFSQYDFFSTAPPYHRISRDSHNFQSLIAMAVFAGLELYIRDAYEADRCCVQRNSVEIVSVLLDAVEKQQTVGKLDDILTITERLVTMGLAIDGSDGSLRLVTRGLSNGYGSSAPTIEDLAVILVGTIPRPRPSIEASSSQFQSTQPITSLRSSYVTELLHKSTPKLVRALLSHGVRP